MLLTSRPSPNAPGRVRYGFRLGLLVFFDRFFGLGQSTLKALCHRLGGFGHDLAGIAQSHLGMILSQPAPDDDALELQARRIFLVLKRLDDLGRFQPELAFDVDPRINVKRKRERPSVFKGDGRFTL